MDLHWLTAVELNAGYISKKFSPLDVMKSLIERADRLDPTIHAFIQIDRDAALEQARAAEQLIMKGQISGALHGVPYGVKDLIDMAGQVTSCHSKVMSNHVAKHDAVVLRQLKAAGAISLGKLALHEFAIGGPAFDLPFPPARNPWNIKHHPGGSSSGSGAAVAAGFIPMAIGTDTGGSVRNPASACGLVGLKPTYDLISRQGVYPLAFSLDHVGPLTRTVKDAAWFLDAMVGKVPGQGPDSYAASVEHGAKGLRVGFVRHFHENDMQADPQVSAALEESVRVFRELGATVVDVTLPPLSLFNDTQKVILMSEGWAVHSRSLKERPMDYCQMSRRKLLTGAFLSAGDYVHAMQRRGELIEAVNQVFQDVDVLLVVNSMDPVCEIDDQVQVVRTYGRQARAAFNLTGHPALALPNGLSSKGLPLSMQILGRFWDEKTVLRAGAAFEQATDWHQRHPSL
jgi:aspartyl-tRNA(Asn)/glutamyl-tRNA(Gln) amidotransferase subunit A